MTKTESEALGATIATGDSNESPAGLREPLTSESNDAICCQRPYPFIICNAARPDECKKQPDGFCAKCFIAGFHADRGVVAKGSK